MPLNLQSLQKNHKKHSFLFYHKRYFNSSSNPSDVRTEFISNIVLFKELFDDNFLIYKNICFLILKFFNITHYQFLDSVNKEKTTGIDLLFPLMFNTYYNIQDRSNFDRSKSFFKQNLPTFKLLGLLLAEVMNSLLLQFPQEITENISSCSPHEIYSFLTIKTKLSVLKDYSSYSVKKTVRKILKSYNHYTTLKQLLNIINELNSGLTQYVFIGFYNHYRNYIFNIDSPENFNFPSVNKVLYLIKFFFLRVKC